MFHYVCANGRLLLVHYESLVCCFTRLCCFQMCVCCVGPTCCWHDLDNSEYDCWPLDKPNEYNMIDCGGENLLTTVCARVVISLILNK